MSRLPRVTKGLLVALPALLLLSCGDMQDYYLPAAADSQQSELYQLAATTEDPQIRATAIQELSGFLLTERGSRPLIAFLTSFLERHPDDPYGALYLYLTGQTYLEDDAPELARFYFERVVTSYPDVQITGVSLRESSLHHLVRISPDPEDRARYLESLIEEFPPVENPGLLHYRLAENLAQLGEWDRVYSVYREILRFRDLEVPGVPGAYREIEDRVAFHDSAKNWTLPSVEQLRASITRALRAKDTAALARYQAKVNFFTRSWEQDFDDPNASPNWNIGELLRLTARTLSVRANVELDADGDEAYLWTYGWGGLRIRTWYLYFRQVHYPPDPEIHGTWEWAGVFLGERL